MSHSNNILCTLNIKLSFYFSIQFKFIYLTRDGVLNLKRFPFVWKGRQEFPTNCSSNTFRESMLTSNWSKLKRSPIKVGYKSRISSLCITLKVFLYPCLYQKISSESDCSILIRATTSGSELKGRTHASIF